jgi:hypothetical protein
VNLARSRAAGMRAAARRARRAAEEDAAQRASRDGAPVMPPGEADPTEDPTELQMFQ